MLPSGTRTAITKSQQMDGASEIERYPRGTKPMAPHAVPASPSSVLIVSRAIRARALICLFSSSPSAVKPPCLRAFRLRLGAPPPAPCIRHTSRPRWPTSDRKLAEIFAAEEVVDAHLCAFVGKLNRRVGR
jgi:hypothetical protein